jgi:hypothetical protein
MRKGFIATLSTMAVLMIATSAPAIGPTVSFPDNLAVWIGPDDVFGQAETNANVFRYTEGVRLLDYVTLGDAFSTTTCWLYATRHATDADGNTSGTFLSGSDVNYLIGDLDASAPSLVPGADGWTSEILTLAGTAAAQLISDIGNDSVLDFRNIRLNPLPGAADGAGDIYAGTVTANPARSELAGYDAAALSEGAISSTTTAILDMDLVTLYVTDKSSTDSVSSSDFLLVTVDEGPDFSVGAGVSWTLEHSYPDFTDSGNTWSLILGATDLPGPRQASIAIANDPNDGIQCEIDIEAGQITYRSPVTQLTVTAGRTVAMFGFAQPANTISVTDDKVYRMSASVLSENSMTDLNASLQVGLNARAGPGFGSYLYGKGASGGPTDTQSRTFEGYLVPVESGSGVLPFIQYVDDDATRGGELFVSDVRIDSVARADLGTGNVIASFGENGDATLLETFSTISPSAPLIVGFVSAQTPSYSAADSTDNEIVLDLTQPISGTQQGLIAIVAGGAYTASGPDKLVIVDASVSTQTADTVEQMPGLWCYSAAPSGMLAAILNERNLDLSSSLGPADQTGRTVSHAFITQANDGLTYDLNIFLLAAAAGQVGDIRITDIVVTEYDDPMDQ